MLTGPSVVNCLRSEDGFGQCLQGRLADAGILPQPATPPAVAEVEAPAETVSTAVAPTEPVEDIAEPALDVVPPQETTDVPDNLIAATFGLLRAEPDGSVVIAGSGTPGTEVEIFANGSLLGRATVETSGDWVLVPDAPLPAGPLEITLGEKGKDGQSEQSFVVVIDEDKAAQPLVVASTPGQASDILQGLERPAPADTARVAIAQTPPSATQAAPTAQAGVNVNETAATEAAPDTVAEAPAAPPQALPPAAPAESPEPAAEASVPAPVATASSEPVAETDTPAAPPAAVPAAEVDTPVASSETPAEPAPASVPATTEMAPTLQEESSAVAEPATPLAETAPQPAAETPESPLEAQPGSEPRTEIAAVEEPPTVAPSAAPATSSLPPSIDAIELEGDRTFFAGGGPEGGIVRLYVDDRYIADAIIAGGRWLVEAGRVLDRPSQRIRVDLLQSGSATVIGRAEVDFVVELPASETPMAVAEADVAASPETPALPAVEAPAAPATEASTQTAQPITPAEPTTPAAPTTATAPDGPIPAAPSVETPEPSPQTPVVAQPPAAPATAPSQPTASVESPPPAPTAAPTAAAAAALETEATPAVPTMVAVSVGGVDAQRFAAGKAIIRRGDNLWTIARRVYGTGVKFTTIYEANTAQIRDPDRIYPGQVFNLPTE